MSVAIVDNFVTVRSKRGDVLNPTQFVSIVSMIEGMLKSVNSFKSSVSALDEHVVNYDDPHDDTAALFPQVIQYIYNIYAQMTNAPMSLSDFNNYVVPSIDFLEITRRILLNRYLYTQVKNIDGSVPTSSTTILGADWDCENIPLFETAVNFQSGITTEAQFIESGWNNSPTLNGYIWTASAPTLSVDDRVILFETTSSEQRFVIGDFGSGFTQSIVPTTNSISVYTRFVYIPTVQTEVMSFQNSLGTVSISIKPDQSLLLTYTTSGGIVTQLLSSPQYAYDGQFWLLMTAGGDVQLTTNSGNFVYDNDGVITMTASKIASVSLYVPMEDLSTTVSEGNIYTTDGTPVSTSSGSLIATSYPRQFGIRQFTVYDGYLSSTEIQSSFSGSLDFSQSGDPLIFDL